MQVYLVQWCPLKHGWTQRLEEAELTRAKGTAPIGHYINHCPECGKAAAMFRTDFVGV